MKICFPYVNRVFNTEIGKVNSVVIENQKLFRQIVEDLNNQIEGLDSDIVLSYNNITLPINKNLELLTQFIPFELNKKTLINKINSKLEKVAISGIYYQKTSELLGAIEQYLIDISFELNCDIEFNKLDISSVIKASGITINEEYNSLAEKIIDYFELVSEFEKKKLFVLVNLRSYIDDVEIEKFFSTVLSHEYNILLIDGFEHKRVNNEERLIIDKDLCEIMG